MFGIEQFLLVYSYAILIYFIILSAAYSFLLICSVPDIIDCFQEKEEEFLNLMTSKNLPPITVIIPAYNEAKNILQTIQSVQINDYPNIQIIIINADSTDETLEILKKEYRLKKITSTIRQKIETIGKLRGLYISNIYNNITVIDKNVRDKSDCVNMGLNACLTPLFFTLDADSIMEFDTIRRIVSYLLSNLHTVTVGGAVYISNACTVKDGKILEKKMSLNPIIAFQTIEYLRSFLFSRAGFNFIGGALCYSGACTLFEEKAVVDIGGFDVGNAALDFEIIAHLQYYRLKNNYPIKIRYLPSAAIWTEVPRTLKQLFKQRARWQLNSLRSIFLHWRMIFNPKYKIVGLFTVPFYLFGEIFGPVIEFSSYLAVFLAYYLNIIDIYFTLLLVIIAFGFSMLLTVASALLNYVTFNSYGKISDLFWIVLYSFIENFSYRQFLVLARVVGTFQFFTGTLNRHIKEVRAMKKNQE